MNLEQRQLAVIKAAEELEKKLAAFGVSTTPKAAPVSSAAGAPGVRPPSAHESLTLAANPAQPPLAALAAVSLIPVSSRVALRA